MPSIHELTNQAGLIFEGTVEQLGASLAAGFPASEKTAIVRVTKIIKGTSSLSGYEGHQITADLLPPVNLQVGQSAVFFTHGIHYGETLVVRELGNVPPGATIDSAVGSAAQVAMDDELTNRLAQSELVISGVASAPKAFGTNLAAGAIPRISEHDPQWWHAAIRVETTEKGENPGPFKDVLFSNSKDIVWHRSPKIRQGDRGIWLLHKRDLRGRALPGHAVVHPLDFHPIEHLDRVRTLLRSPSK